MGEVENGAVILQLSKQVMTEGVLYFREFAFCTDHMVYTRTSSMDDEECGWETRGWRAVQTPDKGLAEWHELSQITIMAEKMRRKGWTVEWNPEFNPALAEFRKRVDGG